MRIFGFDLASGVAPQRDYRDLPLTMDEELQFGASSFICTAA